MPLWREASYAKNQADTLARQQNALSNIYGGLAQQLPDVVSELQRLYKNGTDTRGMYSAARSDILGGQDRLVGGALNRAAANGTMDSGQFNNLLAGISANTGSQLSRLAPQFSQYEDERQRQVLAQLIAALSGYGQQAQAGYGQQAGYWGQRAQQDAASDLAAFTFPFQVAADVLPSGWASNLFGWGDNQPGKGGFYKG